MNHIIARCAIRFAMVLVFFTTVVTTSAADIDVLVVGSEKEMSATLRTSARPSVPFLGSEVATELRKILNGAGLGTVNVKYEDRSAATPIWNDQNIWPFKYFAPNLDSWYSWPDVDAPEAATRWSDLRGENGTDWDYVVLIGDPYTMEYQPGIYAHAVYRIAEQVTAGGGKTVLLMNWPGAGSESNVEHYREVVYRAGRSGGHMVAPAALAWLADGSPVGTTHPGARGAYIAAASVFSRVWNQSAAVSSYNPYPATAQTVLNTVVDNVGKPQFSGPFTFANPWSQYGNYSRFVRPSAHPGGNSHPEGIESATEQAMTRVNANYARGIGAKYYIGRYGLTEAHNVFDMLMSQGYGGGEYNVSAYNSGNEISTLGYTNWRISPAPIVWVEMKYRKPDISLPSDSHEKPSLLSAMGTYVYTMISGRCPVDLDDTNSEMLLGNIAGYRLAWHVSTCQTRAPGFHVKPTTEKVGFTTPEAIKVRFVFPPQSDVIVNVAVNNPDVEVVSEPLRFTPENYQVPQYVQLLAKPSAVPGASFKVTLTTTSDDIVYNGLYDEWTYAVNTRPVGRTQDIIVYSGQLTPITLQATEPDYDSLTYRLSPNHLPEHGTVTIERAVATYQSHEGYNGLDSFSFIVNDGGDDSDPTPVHITVRPKTIYNFNLLQNGSAELSPFSDYGWVALSGAWYRYNTRPAHGTYLFGNGESIVQAKLYQDVNIEDYVERVDHGDQMFRISGYIRPESETAEIYAQFLDASGAILHEDRSGKVGTNDFAYYHHDVLAPVGTKTIRVMMHATDGGDVGRQANGKFDDVRLIALEPENLAPVALPDTIVVTAQMPYPITLKSTDLDPEDKLIYQIVQQPTRGKLTLIGDGPEAIYETYAAYQGSDTFTFKVNDGGIDSNLATVTLDVVSNQAPVIRIDAPRTDHAAVTSGVGILLEATVLDDGKPGPLTLTWSQVGQGSALTFTDPHAAVTGVKGGGGPHTVRLTASDGQLTVTRDLTVAFDVYDEEYPHNIGAYTRAASVFNGYVGQPVNFDDVYASDFDDQPSGGELEILWKKITGPGTVVFENPTQLFTSAIFDTVGEYRVRMIVDDGGIKTYADSVVTITADPTNKQPLAYDQIVNVAENGESKAITLNGFDEEGQTLSYRVIDPPTQGVLGGTGANLTYTPNLYSYGEDSFTFRVNDGKADSNLAKVTIRIGMAAVVVMSESAVSYDSTSATLSGLLSGVGNAWICWGVSDGGTRSIDDWEHVVAIGQVTPGEAFSTLVTGLAANTTYVFRCYAEKEDSRDWSDVAVSFSGTSSTPSAGNPVAGAHFEWDAARDVPGDNTWPSTGTTAYTWTFGGGNLSPVAVADARLTALTKAYEFPAAIDEWNTSWHNKGDTQSVTFEFVLDADSDYGLIFESGSTVTGIQFDILAGVLRGCIVYGGKRYAVTYPLTAADKSRFIHAVFVINRNSNFDLYVDSELKSSVSLAGMADWSSNNGSGLGGTSEVAPDDNAFDFKGKLALFRYYKDKVLKPAEIRSNFAVLSGGDIRNLAASEVRQTTANLHALLLGLNKTYNVTVYYGLSDGGTDPAAWDASATVGVLTNTLATLSHPLTGLTANQTYYYTFMASGASGTVWASPTWSFKTHSVVESQYNQWQEGSFARPFTDTAMTSNPDGDRRNNMMEFAFGTDPTITDMGPLAKDGSKRGDPVVAKEEGGVFALYYIRRVDHGSSGSVVYSTHFSNDLTVFSPSSAGLVVVGSAGNGYELVKVPFPSGSRFGYVKIDSAP